MDAKSPKRLLGAVWCRAMLWTVTAVIFPGVLFLSAFIETTMEGIENIAQPAVASRAAATLYRAEDLR